MVSRKRKAKGMTPPANRRMDDKTHSLIFEKLDKLISGQSDTNVVLARIDEKQGALTRRVETVEAQCEKVEIAVKGIWKYIAVTAVAALTGLVLAAWKKLLG